MATPPPISGVLLLCLDLQAPFLGVMPDGARVETKRRERAAFAADWVAFAPKEAVGAWAMLASPATVAALGRVLERLKKGARSKL